MATDPDGNVIVGPGRYVDANGVPVTLTLSVANAQAGGNGTVTLAGATSFTSPTSAATTAHYDGGWLDSSVISAHASSGTVSTAASATLQMTPAAQEFSANLTATLLGGIVTGPDGALWFTEIAPGAVGRVTPQGGITEYGSAQLAGLFPQSITVGPDGSLWLADAASAISKVTTGGSVTNYTAGLTTPFPDIYKLVSAPDGTLLFTDEAFNSPTIGRITTSGVITEFVPQIPNHAQPLGATIGPDGNFWFVEAFGNCIDSATLAGVVTRHCSGVGGTPWEIVAGPDGRLWYTMVGGGVAAITTSGVVTNYANAFPSGGSQRGIVVGPDGNLWSTDLALGSIYRTTPDGSVTQFSHGLSPGADPNILTVGPDGNIWLTEYSHRRNAKFVL